MRPSSATALVVCAALASSSASESDATAATISPNVARFFHSIDTNHDGEWSDVEILAECSERWVSGELRYHSAGKQDGDKPASGNVGNHHDNDDNNNHNDADEADLKALLDVLDADGNGDVTLTDFAVENGGPFTANETVQQVHISMTGLASEMRVMFVILGAEPVKGSVVQVQFPATAGSGPNGK